MEMGNQPRIFVHHREGPGDEVVRQPLSCNGNGERFATNRVREDFGQQHPTNWSPGHGECGDVKQHRQQSNQPGSLGIKRGTETEHTDGHAQSANNLQRFATKFIHRHDSQHGEAQVDHANNNGL